MGAVGTVLSVIISLLVIGLLIWMVFYPEPFKYLLTVMYPSPDYDANDNAIISKSTTLYTSPNSKHDKLVILFIGGAGLYSTMSNNYGFTNKLNEFLGTDYDVLVFEYPVRFKYTVLDTMLSINKILADYINYETVHAIGISFGALLAGAFYQKEMTKTKATNMQIPQIGIKFASLSLLSGVLECKFNVDVFTALFNFYIMRATPGLMYYTCYGIPIPKFIVSANTDFLVSQTSKFIQSEQCQYKIYQSHTLPHAFCQYTNLDEAIETIQSVRDFIVSVDNPSTSAVR